MFILTITENLIGGRGEDVKKVHVYFGDTEAEARAEALADLGGFSSYMTETLEEI
ncbi:hypothetical protein SEA_FRANKLIN22_15 [Microbacterium phage Franklin22]|uniref:hypothetical protein n=1 Tax=Microbacterium phage Franklin22 TaxID=2894293 RepID=UPI001E6C0AE8|nr:hypothetical protein QDW15_gp15 [Microbacterium phage Franklin22]UGL61828.1 hypothetical protein SEA_FRANKLIN22_15 [Microbacterium phage Franklin22]